MAEETDNPKGISTKTKQILVLVVMGVVLIAISVGGTWFALRWWTGSVISGVQPEEVLPADAVKKTAIYYPLQPTILVSFNVQGQRRLLQAELTLLTRDEVTATALAEHRALLQSSLMMLFSGQDFSELQTLEGKELLRQLALADVQRLMEQETGNPGVEQVLFTSFIMQ